MTKIANYQLPGILIVGTGALASLFAARLARAGHSTTMLGSWKAGLEALQKDGVRLLDSAGNEHRFLVQATSDPRECRGIHHALVLVKAWQTEFVAEQLRECVAAEGLAVTLQNGLGNRETLARSLGSNHVALGVTTTGATLLGPGLVREGGEGVISMERHPALGPVDEALRSANFNVDLVEDAQSLIWGKLVINAAINPLTAILRVPNGKLLELPSAREMMKTLARETASGGGGKDSIAVSESRCRGRRSGAPNRCESLVHAAGCATRRTDRDRCYLRGSSQGGGKTYYRDSYQLGMLEVNKSPDVICRHLPKFIAW